MSVGETATPHQETTTIVDDALGTHSFERRLSANGPREKSRADTGRGRITPRRQKGQRSTKPSFKRPLRPSYGRPSRDKRPLRPSYGRPSYDSPARPSNKNRARGASGSRYSSLFSSGLLSPLGQDAGRPGSFRPGSRGYPSQRPRDKQSESGPTLRSFSNPSSSPARSSHENLYRPLYKRPFFDTAAGPSNRRLYRPSSRPTYGSKYRPTYRHLFRDRGGRPAFKRQSYDRRARPTFDRSGHSPPSRQHGHRPDGTKG